MPQDNRVAGLIRRLESLLAHQYQQIYINNRFYFLKPTGEVFCLTIFPGADAIVVEYADNCAEAERNRFEDGDTFFLDGLDDESLIQNVLTEIGS